MVGLRRTWPTLRSPAYYGLRPVLQHVPRLLHRRDERLLRAGSSHRHALDANHVHVGDADKAEHGAEIGLLEVVRFGRARGINSATGQDDDRPFAFDEPLWAVRAV